MEATLIQIYIWHVRIHLLYVYCRIDQHGVIKVADFGMSEDMYVRNYFRRDKSEEESEEKVPIRWMAPESIEKDVYNEKTDVVRHRPLFSFLVVGLCLL